MTIEIRDPQIDNNKIRQQIAERLTTHPTGPDPKKMGPPGLHISAQVENEDAGESFPDLRESLIDLMVTHRLKEPEFTSDAPVVGPVIVTVRRFWNWMSTKWYVRPIIKQQSNTNGRLAMLLLQMAELQNRKDDEIVELRKRVDQLESSLQERFE